MRTTIEKSKAKRSAPARQNAAHESAGLANSALLSMMERSAPAAGGGSSISDLGRAVERRMPQMPVAEAEADRLSANVSGGTPESVKAAMGQKLGADLSDVRIHTGAAAAARADGMGARAYASGRDIFFGSGGFDAQIAAHELVHTAQQGAAPGAAVGVSAPTGGVQMWPWGKKKPGAATTAPKDKVPEKETLGDRMGDSAFNFFSGIADKIFSWADKRSGSTPKADRQAELETANAADMQELFSEDAPAAPQKKGIFSRMGGAIKGVFSSGADFAARKLSSLKRKNERAVDTFNMHRSKYEEMSGWDRFKWSMANPIARMTASRRVGGTMERALHADQIEDEAAKYREGLSGSDRGEAYQLSGDTDPNAPIAADDVTYEDLLAQGEDPELVEELRRMEKEMNEGGDTEAPTPVSDADLDQMITDGEDPEIVEELRKLMHEEEGSTESPMTDADLDQMITDGEDPEIVEELRKLMHKEEGGGEESAMSDDEALAQLEAELENEAPEDPADALRASLHSSLRQRDEMVAQQPEYKKQLAASRKELNAAMAASRHHGKYAAEAFAPVGTAQPQEEEPTDIPETVGEISDLASQATGQFAGDLDDHYEFLSSGGKSGAKMSGFGQAMGAATSTLSGVSETMNVVQGVQNTIGRHRMGDRAGAVSSGLRTAGSLGSAASSFGEAAQYVSPVALAAMQDIAPGIGVGVGALNTAADIVDAGAAGVRNHKLKNRSAAYEQRVASGEHLNAHDEMTRRILKQARGAAKADLIQSSMSAVGNGIQTAANAGAIAASATGAGVPVGLALSALGKVGSGISSAGEMIGDSKRKDVRTNVANEEKHVDLRVERFMRDHPEYSYRDAKHIVIKGLGYRSGKRTEVAAHTTVKRTDELIRRAQSGDAEAQGILKDMQVSQKRGQYSRDLVGERLAIGGEGDTLDEKLSSITGSRDMSNPFRPKKPRRSA